MVSVLMMSVVVVYLALVVQFNRFRLPLVVLTGSVPLALSGAMMFSFLNLTTINIYAQIGFVTLVGLIAKNAILITEFAHKQQEHGLSKYEAIRTAASLRLRPVLMTTAATCSATYRWTRDWCWPEARKHGYLVAAWHRIVYAVILLVFCGWIRNAPDKQQDKQEPTPSQSRKAPRTSWRERNCNRGGTLIYSQCPRKHPVFVSNRGPARGLQQGTTTEAAATLFLKVTWEWYEKTAVGPL